MSFSSVESCSGASLEPLLHRFRRFPCTLQGNALPLIALDADESSSCQAILCQSHLLVCSWFRVQKRSCRHERRSVRFSHGLCRHHIAPFHMSSMAQPQLGCSKCRYAKRGCGRCRDPEFQGRAARRRHISEEPQQPACKRPRVRTRRKRTSKAAGEDAPTSLKGCKSALPAVPRSCLHAADLREQVSILALPFWGKTVLKTACCPVA